MHKVFQEIIFIFSILSHHDHQAKNSRFLKSQHFTLQTKLKDTPPWILCVRALHTELCFCLYPINCINLCCYAIWQLKKCGSYRCCCSISLSVCIFMYVNIYDGQTQKSLHFSPNIASHKTTLYFWISFPTYANSMQYGCNR